MDGLPQVRRPIEIIQSEIIWAITVRRLLTQQRKERKVVPQGIKTGASGWSRHVNLVCPLQKRMLYLKSHTVWYHNSHELLLGRLLCTLCSAQYESSVGNNSDTGGSRWLYAAKDAANNSSPHVPRCAHRYKIAYLLWNPHLYVHVYLSTDGHRLILTCPHIHVLYVQ